MVLVLLVCPPLKTDCQKKSGDQPTRKKRGGSNKRKQHNSKTREGGTILTLTSSPNQSPHPISSFVIVTFAAFGIVLYMWGTCRGVIIFWIFIHSFFHLTIVDEGCEYYVPSSRSDMNDLPMTIFPAVARRIPRVWKPSHPPLPRPHPLAFPFL